MVCQTPGVRVGRDEYPLFTPIPVYVLSHEGDWLPGTVRQCRENAQMLALQMELPIKGGTSGSCPRPHMALPVWVCRKVLPIR